MARYASTSGVLQGIRGFESVGVALQHGISPYAVPPQLNTAYYNTGAKHSDASGAYQFLSTTWQRYTQESGIGTQYGQAYLAPPYIQDAVAAYVVNKS